jgi:uncharacterized protein YodC (DUF2158 family)
MSDEFTTGQLVMLVSGGQPMTVDWQGEEPTGDLVPCVWFDSDKRFFERKISRAALEVYKSQYDIMMEAGRKAIEDRASAASPRL